MTRVSKGHGATWGAWESKVTQDGPVTMVLMGRKQNLGFKDHRDPKVLMAQKGPKA